ncbi:MAG: tRNA pseudouridine(55) synthase TruB [Clostridiales bacterium]|nr:tRNA pseudouridine(55) synthase TruB [Clostridiales bacterium]
MDGVLNIYKPQNMTSHDVVAIVRGALQTKKVGHTGTLDPMATGVLPICVGRATKIVDFIQNDKKTYKTEITLGIETDTEDCWGETIKECPVDVTDEQFRDAIMSFVGEISQVPPMYSALKVDGKKLYELARAGKTVERKARLRTIFDITIESISGTKATFYVTCSKGTYIRTLCSDIGRKLNTVAHMSALERTQSGQFTLETAISIDDVKSLGLELQKQFLSIDEALGFDKKIHISTKAKELIQNGVKIDLMRYVSFDYSNDDYVLVYENKQFLALAQFINDTLKVTKIFEIKRV